MDYGRLRESARERKEARIDLLSCGAEFLSRVRTSLVFAIGRTSPVLGRPRRRSVQGAAEETDHVKTGAGRAQIGLIACGDDWVLHDQWGNCWQRRIRVELNADSGTAV